MNMEKIKTVQDDQLLDYLDGKLEGPALLQLKQGLERLIERPVEA